MGPKFSVITVCLNEVATIRRTCESICAQTFQGFEWIVIDGGSTDGTLAVLGEYRDRMTHLVSEPDSGIYNAMNKGVTRACGETVVFMNGGDFFADNGALAAVASAPHRDIIFGNVVFDGVNPSVQTYPDELSSGYLLDNMLPHQASFIRRGLFEVHGLHDESYRIAGDYEMFARLLCRHRVSYHHIDRVLAVFSDEGISRNRSMRMLRKRENHRVRKQYFPRYRTSIQCLREELRCRFLRP
jgi:glycosyltransferase involved in cell wall biosynthesis